MPKFVVRGADKPEEIVEFWLEGRGTGEIRLCANTPGRHRTVFVIRSDGTCFRPAFSDSFPHLRQDDKGRIKEVE